jgi:ABC-type sugar transport system substrate-binding protein
MKKSIQFIAILLVLCMAFVISACGGSTSSSGGGNSGGSTSGGSTSSGGNTSDSGGASSGASAPKEIGFYDRTFDYNQNKEFKVGYLVSATGVMYDTFSEAFARWAGRTNVNYTGMWAPADTSTEAFLSGVETYADMGYDGLLIDGDPNLGASVAKICNDNDILWMMCMAQARDYSTPYTIMGEPSVGALLAPNVGFNNIAVGSTIAEGLMDWKEEAYPDVSWDKVGFIATDFSLSIPIHERTLGNEQVWAERSGLGGYDVDPSKNPKNFIIADGASGQFDQATATNIVTQILSDPPDGIEVWLISGVVWDYAAGAAVAIENVNLSDKACITTFGAGANAVALWDAGDPTPIRISLETAAPVYAESIFNGLYAMMAGYATPDTLWNEWSILWDKGDKYQLTDELDPESQTPIVELDSSGKPIVLEEHNYPSLILPMIWVNQENYKEFYGWVDLYDLGPDATQEERTYPDYPLATDVNLFQARSEVPAFYSQYPSGD